MVICRPASRPVTSCDLDRFGRKSKNCLLAQNLVGLEWFDFGKLEMRVFIVRFSIFTSSGIIPGVTGSY